MLGKCKISYSNLNVPWLIRWISFRQIASFGGSTICLFKHNVADMKKLAARDFEDILQVILFLVRLHIQY
jgi:hypothetical protein